MPCYSPIKGYRARYRNKSGKRPIVFKVDEGYDDQPVTVACGRCMGCRLEYSRQWAIRCVHEAQMHDENCFITLTYAPEHLPPDHSIRKEEVQKFMKRLRKAAKVRLRYFACGEYGTKNNRPHYHAIIFGYSFPDRKLWTIKNGNRLYRSELLESVWTKGHSSIGECTFESAAYVARYVTKKYTKPEPSERSDARQERSEEKINMKYTVVDDTTGEIFTLEPEFALMSRRPGIGRSWLEKYRNDTNKDFITIRGAKMSLPKYYDQIIEEMEERDELIREEVGTAYPERQEPEMWLRKQRRISKVDKADNTIDRLRVKENVKLAQFKMLHRGLENEVEDIHNLRPRRKGI